MPDKKDDKEDLVYGLVKDLVKDVGGRVSNRITSSFLITALIWNWRNIVCIALAPKITPQVIGKQVDLAIHSPWTYVAGFGGIVAWNYALPWLNYKMNSSIENLFEMKEKTASLGRRMTYEETHKALIDIRTGNAEKDELIAEKLEIEKQRDEYIRRLNIEEENNRTNLQSIKELEEEVASLKSNSNSSTETINRLSTENQELNQFKNNAIGQINLLNESNANMLVDLRATKEANTVLTTKNKDSQRANRLFRTFARSIEKKSDIINITTEDKYKSAISEAKKVLLLTNPITIANDRRNKKNPPKIDWPSMRGNSSTAPEKNELFE